MKKLIIVGALLITTSAWADVKITVNGKPVEVVRCSTQTGLNPPETVDCLNLPAIGPDDNLIIQAAEKVDLAGIIRDLQTLTGR